MIPPARKAPTKRRSTAARGSARKDAALKRSRFSKNYSNASWSSGRPIRRTRTPSIRHVHRERQLRAAGAAHGGQRLPPRRAVGNRPLQVRLRDYQSALVAFRRSRTLSVRELVRQRRSGMGISPRSLRRADPGTPGPRARSDRARTAHAAALHHDDGGPAAENRLFDLYAAAGQLQLICASIAAQPIARRSEVVAHRFRILDLEQARAWPDLVHERRSRFRQGHTDAGRPGPLLVMVTIPFRCLFIEVDKIAPHTCGPRRLWRTLGALPDDADGRTARHRLRFAARREDASRRSIVALGWRGCARRWAAGQARDRRRGSEQGAAGTLAKPRPAHRPPGGDFSAAGQARERWCCRAAAREAVPHLPALYPLPREARACGLLMRPSGAARPRRRCSARRCRAAR